MFVDVVAKGGFERPGQGHLEVLQTLCVAEVGVAVFDLKVAGFQYRQVRQVLPGGRADIAEKASQGASSAEDELLRSIEKLLRFFTDGFVDAEDGGLPFVVME